MRRVRRRKSKVILVSYIIALGVLLGVLLFTVICLVGSMYNKDLNIFKKVEKQNQPEDILTTYMSSISANDYEKMYQLLTEQSRSYVTKEEFIKRNQKIYEGIDVRNINIKISEINKNKYGAVINYQTSMDTAAGKITFQNSVFLPQNEEKKYRIEWDSKLIFPNLGNEDKVRVTTTKGRRGSILDRNGNILAGKGTAASVGLVPGKMSENSKEDIKKLAEILHISEETINKNLNASYVKPDSFVPLKLIPQAEQETKDKLLEISGVMITDQEVRAYPLGESAAHLTGYVQNINADELKELNGKGYNQTSLIGKSGLEKLLEDRIRGIDGCEISIIDKYRNNKETLAEIPSVDGEDVKLTIDADLQSKLYKQLKDEKSSTVVMNPKTGEILALISTPAYDPNEFVLGMSSEKWKKLNDSKAKPMYNRFKAALCPGSSFKPIIAAVGLSTGTIVHEENFGHSGLSWQKDASWGSYKVTTLKDYGNQVTMRNALIYSDNIYFAKAALKIGEDILAEQLLNMGFDETIPFEFGLSLSEFGTNNKFDTEIQLGDSGYGQGKVLVNPIHLVSLYSAFVNEGNMIQPYLVYKENPSPEYWKEHIFTKEAADTIKNDLIQVVENPNGTGHGARISGLTIAGKTGTAEIKASKEDTNGTELGWFTAFTVDDGEEEYLASCMVENVKQRGGSHFVIPIIKSVFKGEK